MSAMSDSLENGLADLIFQNVDLANIGDAGGLRGSVSAGNLYVSIHTSSPGDAGDQTTNEVGTGSWDTYGRIAVVRSGSGWAVSGDTADNVADVTFAKKTNSSTTTCTHVGIGTAATLAGLLLFHGALAASVDIEENDRLVLEAGDLDVTFA